MISATNPNRSENQPGCLFRIHVYFRASGIHEHTPLSQCLWRTFLRRVPRPNCSNNLGTTRSRLSAWYFGFISSSFSARRAFKGVAHYRSMRNHASPKTKEDLMVHQGIKNRTPKRQVVQSNLVCITTFIIRNGIA